VRRLLLIRHPETQANVEGRYLGRADGPYSARGERQATLLAQGLAEWRPDVILSSPARRALAPAILARDTASCRHVVHAGLAEFDVGHAEGLTHEEAVAQGVVDDSLMLVSGAAPFTGGESTTGFLTRCRDVVEAIAGFAEQRVALVSHQGPIRAMLVDLLGLPAESMWRFAVRPAYAVQLTLSEGFAVLDDMALLRPEHQGGTMLRSR
jgi:broad specificity phosphatase PhoE